MNEDGKSYSPVVPAKPPNKAIPAAAEVVEERGLAKGNTASKTRSGLRAGMRVPHALDRVRQVAKRDKEMKFTTLLHHITVESLGQAYLGLRPQAAPGVLDADLTAPRGRLTGRIWRRISRTCTGGCKAGRIERSQRAGHTSPRQTGGSGRSASPAWRTRLPNAPSSGC